MNYANDVNRQLEPAILCGTTDELNDIGCNNIYYPVGVINMVFIYLLQLILE